METKLLVKEIYGSIQGESTWAGLPCIFVRLTGCDLRCSYCDSVYAFRGGERMTIESILSAVEGFAQGYVNRGQGLRLPLVEITGGEPMLQKAVLPLMSLLIQAGFQVLIETSGAHDIQKIHPAVRRIVDLKCPSSGESERMVWSNIDHLQATDEIKFVIASHEDYEWAKDVLETYHLSDRCAVLFSSVAPLSAAQQSSQLNPFPNEHHLLNREGLVERILADHLPVRFQLQMHKFIWAPDQTGV